MSAIEDIGRSISELNEIYNDLIDQTDGVQQTVGDLDTIITTLAQLEEDLESPDLEQATVELERLSQDLEARVDEFQTLARTLDSAVSYLDTTQVELRKGEKS
ncbi:MAG: hypothetical protein JRI39_00435 [Deltaproteobacteria bacterium]|nr:hypothetical protein [Deltaproteobacteria bacterium]